MMLWDQRLARILVRPLAATAIRPNHITAVTLLLALTAGVLFARGNLDSAAGLFVTARFLDHFDGELARVQGTTSRFGYYFDYVVGGLSYAALFVGLGLGPGADAFGGLGLLLGFGGGACALLSLGINLGIDRVGEREDAVGYPGFAGLDLEDGVYLLAPVTWLGYLEPFFLLAGIGATVYAAWSASQLLGLISRRGSATREAPGDNNSGQRRPNGGSD